MESLVWEETGVKAEILIYRFKALTWSQSTKRIQFATLGANDAAIKHYCKMKVNPKSNPILFYFFFISCLHFPLLLFSSPVCEWREFLFFLLGI
jgi:hypothetical protein